MNIPKIGEVTTCAILFVRLLHTPEQPLSIELGLWSNIRIRK